MAYLSWTNFFWYKPLLLLSSNYWPLSLCKSLKKPSPNENFFRKAVNDPCFFHSCLSTCQKSKPDINLLVKYWQLKNTEISLAKRLRRMLINHKNFHFTQIPDKTNDMIFLKSPKTMFLGHFWPFSAVTHNYIWAPNTMLSFRKN